MAENNYVCCICNYKAESDLDLDSHIFHSHPYIFSLKKQDVSNTEGIKSIWYVSTLFGYKWTLNLHFCSIQNSKFSINVSKFLDKEPSVLRSPSFTGKARLRNLIFDKSLLVACQTCFQSIFFIFSFFRCRRRVCGWSCRRCFRYQSHHFIITVSKS